MKINLDDLELDELDDDIMFEKFSQKKRPKMNARTKQDEIKDKRRERAEERDAMIATEMKKEQ